ncbi:MAG TPA: ATP-binding protein [Polyangiaceae bacterium]|nr:ATP-binding protein [Polyangiaceae bacterium]
MKRIIFVGGIHGVGKTTLCRAVAEEMGVTHVSASELVRAGGGVSEPATKVVSQIAANQAALIAALGALDDQVLILDGHFSLLTTESRIEAVPLSTFAAMEPVALVLVSGQTEDVRSRLRDRDGAEYDAELLSEFQDAEAAHAVRVGTALGRPLLCTTPDRICDLLSFAQRALLPNR